MGISDRIEGSIEKWRSLWGEVLKSWLVNILSFGLEVFFNILGKAFAPKLKPIIDKLEATGEVPPELQPLLDEMKTPTGEIAAILGWSAGGALMGGAIGKVVDALFLRFGYSMMRQVHPVLPTVEQAIAYWLRHPEWEATLEDILKAQGADDITRDTLKDLSQGRLDVGTVTSLWLRNKSLYEHLWKDIQDQGIDPARIALLKKRAEVIPPLADMVRFADYGGFDPKIIAEWRASYDAPGFITDPMSLIGLTNEPPWEWANRYWFSHWTQPGRFELSEMFRRGLLSGKPYPSGRPMTAAEIAEGERITKITYLTQGFSQYWQDKLVGLLRELPTRVDIRRWWDMRTISEDRLRELYQARGYFAQDLDDYVLWTKVYVAFPDLMARWSNGWITEEDVRSELTALGMPADRVEEMIQAKKKSVDAGKVDEGKALTKSEIYKGVKAATITRDQAIDLLVDLNYTESQAEYLIDINVGALAGSPETYEEFKDITTKYKIAIGKKEKPMPEELKAAAAEVVTLTKDVETLRAALKEAVRGLIGEEVLPGAATAKVKEFRVDLHRAESALELAKSNYDQLLAEWRHGA